MKTTRIDRLKPAFREVYLDRKVMGAPYAKRIFGLLGLSFRLGCTPLFLERFPWVDPDQNNLTCLPVNQDIEGAEGAGLACQVLDRFVERARHRVIVDICPCRKVLGCRKYPIDVGCIMMGESAIHIPKKISREVGVEEARAHVRRAIEAGLIPTTGRVRIDKDFFMVPGDGKLLTLCFCCECCSATRLFRHVPHERLDRMYPPVEGLSILVTDACDGCGECVEKCHVCAIGIEQGRAAIGKMCRVCGRCATHCPRDAIRLRLENPGAVQDVVSRIEASVEY